MEVIGCIAKIGNKEDFLRKFKDRKMLFLDARQVLGKNHVISAYERAKRAFDNGKNISDDILIETMLYVAGERQISKALKKVSIKDNIDKIAVLILDGNPENLPFKRDDSILEPSDEKLLSIFGKKYEMLEEKSYDIIFERMSLLEIKK